MKEWKIKISGFGGQGVILSGYAIGTCATIYEKHYASMIQSYGPEARGGACSTQITIHDAEIKYPLVDNPDVLLAMSQEGYDKHCRSMVEYGKIFYDEDLVEPVTLKKNIFQYKIPATRLAESIGKKIVANMVMIGFMLGNTRILSPESFEKAIEKTVPNKFLDVNKKAFYLGFNYIPEKEK